MTAAAALVAPAPPRSAGVPLALTASSGSLGLATSVGNAAVLRTANLAPGGGAEGTVTIRNTGTVAGALRASAANVRTSGGELAGSVAIELWDRTDPQRAALVYRGSLTGMQAVPLGNLAPQSGRVFRLRATVPATLDNRFQGSWVAFDLVWRAEAGAGASSPPACTPPLAAGDRRPPIVRLRLQSRSALRRGRPLTVWVRTDEPASGTVTAALTDGKRRLRLLGARGKRLRLRANRTVRLRIALGRRARSFVRSRLARRRAVGAVIAVSARDAAGNRRTVRGAIALGRLPRAALRAAQAEDFAICTPAASDRRPPALRVKLSGATSVARGRAPLLSVRADEKARATLTATFSYGKRSVRITRPKPRRLQLQANRTRRVRLSLGKRWAAIARREARRGRTLTLRVWVTARDLAGNSRRARATLRWRPRRR